MNAIEYSEKMIELMHKQSELKKAHQQYMNSLSEELNSRLRAVEAEIKERRNVAEVAYRNRQFELECEKQRLKAKYNTEREVEEIKRINQNQ